MVQAAHLVAAVPGLKGEPVGAVEKGLVAGLIGLKIRPHGVLKGLVLVVDRLLGQSVLDQRIHIAGEFGVVLQVGVGAVIDAAGHNGVTAQEAGLLNKDHAGTLVGGCDGGRQAGSAAAHDDDVGGVFGVLCGSLLDGLLQGGHVHTGTLQSGLHAVQDSPAGDGDAGDGIHRQRLGLHHPLGDQTDGPVHQARGLHILGNIYILNAVFGHGDLHRHRPMHTGNGSSVGARCVAAGGLGLFRLFGGTSSQREHHGPGQEQGQCALFHILPSFLNCRCL